jgi:hypothetical protein
MAGLDPAIHEFLQRTKAWMPGTRPGMTRSFETNLSGIKNG